MKKHVEIIYEFQFTFMLNGANLSTVIIDPGLKEKHRTLIE